MVSKYMKNTHAKTHSNYTVDIVQILRVSREGEAERFKKFSGTKNRMLLWHASRLTNWTGILKQGLRIAPPEAPRSSRDAKARKTSSVENVVNCDPLDLLAINLSQLGEKEETRMLAKAAKKTGKRHGKDMVLEAFAFKSDIYLLLLFERASGDDLQRHPLELIAKLTMRLMLPVSLTNLSPNVQNTTDFLTGIHICSPIV
ncbi:hypothetical protein POM88_045970 [Heracleum sosnowskyi]|uniref:Poly [ADP-ribose] polymerase n=1 Tax=Heracleum sosnowskyi TaxID=360622 RepID=A0AAD8H7Z6_9APIA|nr:hypothetical protein POM88_045970 [Heracleum sosnowskyi]